MRDYKHIFFDLDHTLWDFESNSKKTLAEIFDTFQLKQKGIFNFDQFYQTYQPINDQYWYLYHNKKVAKAELRVGRFRETLSRFNIEDEAMAEGIAAMYLNESPKKHILFPNALEILEQLAKRYTLHIITNGFKEVQHQKIENSGLNPFFKTTIISEDIGFQKPQPEIFDYALKIANAEKNNCLMSGDNILTDIEGAMNFGIDAVLFNPQKKWHKAKPTFEINSLNELNSLL